MLTPMLYGLLDARIHQTQILERCAELMDAGKLDVHVHQTLPLADAARAHRLLEQGGVMGKIVLLTAGAEGD
jgi:NADPH2:quinone reductase